ncbi:hypothetical protein V2G26_005623 [Clonostachys chloroleuca]
MLFKIVRLPERSVFFSRLDGSTIPPSFSRFHPSHNWAAEVTGWGKSLPRTYQATAALAAHDRDARLPV